MTCAVELIPALVGMRRFLELIDVGYNVSLLNNKIELDAPFPTSTPEEENDDDCDEVSGVT